MRRNRFRKCFRLFFLLSLLPALAGGCSSRKQVAAARPAPQSADKKIAAPLPPASLSSTDLMEGTASWYGEPYHGRRTAAGEIYDMCALTAAHNTLPFDSRVLVQNMRNKKTVFVRINDRGPFVGGRIIDLSYTAAKRIDMIGAGTAPVRLVLSPAHNLSSKASELYTIQVGFFLEKENARRWKEQLSRNYKETRMVSATGGGYRVQVGRYGTRQQAEQFRRQLEEAEIRGVVRLISK